MNPVTIAIFGNPTAATSLAVSVLALVVAMYCFAKKRYIASLVSFICAIVAAVPACVIFYVDTLVEGTGR